MRETVDLLISGTDKGDVKVTFDKVSDIDRYINTLLVMREDLETKIEVAKAEKRARKRLKKVGDKVNKSLADKIAELDRNYEEFCADFDKLSNREKDSTKNFKNLIDFLYSFDKKMLSSIIKENNE